MNDHMQSERINTWAYASGLLCDGNEWTSADARRRCLVALVALETRTKRAGAHLVCEDGSRLEIDEYGMFAV